jgi:hypothetical protein
MTAVSFMLTALSIACMMAKIAQESASPPPQRERQTKEE